jgi:pyruvate/2-oxoacid:ferredoxin oxidoreductase beta subunit/Pyruvate/2-oxoacid:ferredoxin oxidoreductase gamma subunit
VTTLSDAPSGGGTYRNDRAYGFCPGCGHARVLDALDRALVRQGWDPAEVVIISDIGCVGLSDQYFATSAFHGLHGRSLTYATGVKLARPELHVVVLIGDGGCGIGGAHLVSAARRNIGVTTLVFNNLNFGMTGGEHSVTTPPEGQTATTPWGNVERPMDIAGTVAVNGATYVWRGTATDAELEEHIAAALAHEGFALLDIWELCVAHYAAANAITPRALTALMDELGFARGLVRHETRPEYAAALRQRWAPHRGEPAGAPHPVAVRERSPLDRRFSVVIAGSAGAHVRTAGRFLGLAATMSGLWATQRGDYPVTVRSGHSVSEVVLAPEEVLYTGVAAPDALFVLSEAGYHSVAGYVRRMQPEGRLFVVPAFAELESPAATVVLDPATFRAVPRAGMALAAVAWGMSRLGLLPRAALLAAAEAVSASHAEQNRQAVAAALGPDLQTDLQKGASP